MEVLLLSILLGLRYMRPTARYMSLYHLTLLCLHRIRIQRVQICHLLLLILVNNHQKYFLHLHGDYLPMFQTRMMLRHAFQNFKMCQFQIFTVYRQNLAIIFQTALLSSCNRIVKILCQNLSTMSSRLILASYLLCFQLR
jgi:hypothetical protein